MIKNNPPPCAQPDNPEAALCHGFTLLELMVAIALAAGVTFFAFSTYLHFYKSTLTRQDKNYFYFAADNFTAVFQRKLLSESIINITESKVTTRNTLGNTTRFTFDNDELRINDRSVPVSVRRFRLNVLGPGVMSADENDWLHNPHRLAYLDEDMDGFISMEELDEDGSGSLEKEECSKIGLVTAEIGYISNAGDTITHKVRIHPRNRTVESFSNEEDDIF